jgi:hypothetical protein
VSDVKLGGHESDLTIPECGLAMIHYAVTSIHCDDHDHPYTTHKVQSEVYNVQAHAKRDIGGAKHPSVDTLIQIQQTELRTRKHPSSMSPPHASRMRTEEIFSTPRRLLSAPCCLPALPLIKRWHRERLTVTACLAHVSSVTPREPL